MKKVTSLRAKNKHKKLDVITKEHVEQNIWHDAHGNTVDTGTELISLLLPPAVKEFFRQLEAEVESLCGKPYSRLNDNTRWGTQKGSVYLAGHKLPIERPRVRAKNGEEQALETYESFQDKNAFDEHVFIEGLKKVSQRDYEKGLPTLANSFGFKKSTVSKAWIRSTTKRLDELMNRDISAMDIVSVFIDGKRFLTVGTIVALGVSTTGKKFVLGVYQANTENSSNCLELLNDLEKRGLPSLGMLFVVDGGSGINKALELKYAVDCDENKTAIRIRCHIHKLRNIEDALGRENEKMPEVATLFNGMRNAEALTEAKVLADRVEKILSNENQSALRSFLEAKTDLLIIHKLGLGQDLKKFFSTTNPIESLNSITGEDLRRVKRWKNSSQFQRWFATSALNAETRMRKVKG